MSRARSLSFRPWWLAAPAAVLAFALWPAASSAELQCDYDSNGLPKNCTQVPGDGGGGGEACDWECKEYNRQQRHEYRAWKANDKGIKAMRRGEFDKARAQYNEALSHVPGYIYAQNNLETLRQNEFYYTQIWGWEALDRGEYDKARAFFNRALALAYNPEYRAAIQRALARLDYESRFKPAGSMMILGTGVQTGWNVQAGMLTNGENQQSVIRRQLELAKRDLPEGVNLELFNIGMGIAVSTVEYEDLFRRVLSDQWARAPVPRSGTSAYNSIRGKRFDLLGCHSNGAMTCLYALLNEDAAARDVVLYGPQITGYSAVLWERLLSQGKIRSLRIVLNEADPVPPLAMVINSYTLFDTTQEPLLFNDGGLKSTISRFVPSAQVDVRSCSFKLGSPLACHRMTAYPQCKASRLPPKIVPGTKGFLGRTYTEPPPPNC